MSYLHCVDYSFWFLPGGEVEPRRGGFSGRGPSGTLRRQDDDHNHCNHYTAATTAVKIKKREMVGRGITGEAVRRQLLRQEVTACVPMATGGAVDLLCLQ